MSAILRVYGENFDIESLLSGCTLPVCAVKRRGEPIFPASQTDGRRHDQSGIHVPISTTDFRELPFQIAQATEFLKTNFEQVRRLREFQGIDGITLDFGIARRDVIVQCDRFPAKFVQLAGSLGLDIELSQYPIETTDSRVDTHAP